MDDQGNGQLPQVRQKNITGTARRISLLVDRKQYVKKDLANRRQSAVIGLPTNNKRLLVQNPTTISIRPKPPAQHITIDQSTITPIASSAHPIKLIIPTTINNTITITAKMPNGSRSIVNGSSILSTVVAANKPQTHTLKPNSIPPCTTLTRIPNIPSLPMRNSLTGVNNHQEPLQKKDLVLMPPEISVVENKSAQLPPNKSNYITIEGIHKTIPSFSIYTPAVATAQPPAQQQQTSLPSELIHLTNYMNKQQNIQLPQTTATLQPIRVTSAEPQSNVFSLNTSSISHFSLLPSMQLLPANKSINRVSTLNSDTPATPEILSTKSMTNLQITNGVLSDRKGPIGMLSGDTSAMNELTITPTIMHPKPDVVTSTRTDHDTSKNPMIQANTALSIKAMPNKNNRMQHRTLSLVPPQSRNRGKKQRFEKIDKPKVFLALAPKSPQPKTGSGRSSTSPVQMSTTSRTITPPVLVGPPIPPVLMDTSNSSTSPPVQAAQTIQPSTSPDFLIYTKQAPNQLTLIERPSTDLTTRSAVPSEKSEPPSSAKQLMKPQKGSSTEINIEKTNLSNICASLFESLECPEQMDDKSSTKSKSVTPEKPDEQPSTAEIPVEGVKATAATDKVSRIEFVRQIKPLFTTSAWRSGHRGFKGNDPLKHIKWHKGIGYLPNTDLTFATNEFQMVEQMPRNPNILINHMFAKSVHDGAFLHASKPSNSKKANDENGSSVLASSIAGPTNKRSQQTLLKSLARQRALSNGSSGSSNSGQPIGNQLITIPVQGGPFNWEIYLEHTKARAAPTNLFYNPFPSAPNSFEVGMKLESIDPQNCSRFCVVSIVQIVGYRLRLQFDGHGPDFIFWCNADSQDIFPAGWCQKTGRTLMPPPTTPYGTTFDWQTYLESTNSRAAPRTYFTHLNSSTTGNEFVRGMKLEADDLRNSRKMCVATVVDVLDNRILIHFDGWNEKYDYWTDINSPYIHPVNWHLQNGFSITGPPNHVSPFCWKMYLAATKSSPAPVSAFGARAPMGFEIGMKLEIVDKKNPSLIRPATILDVVEYEIRVLFDGWPDEYAYWMDDDHPDLHPIRWCERTGHPLEITPKAPKYSRMHNCAIPACRGIGNVKNVCSGIHLMASECPYNMVNWKAEDLPNRLDEYYDIVKRNKRLTSLVHKRLSVSESTCDLDQRRSIDAKRAKYDLPSPMESATPQRESLVSVSPPQPPIPVIIEVEPTIKMEVLSDSSSESDTRESPPFELVAPHDPPNNQPDDTPIITEADVKELLPYTRHLLHDYLPTLRGTYYMWRFHSRNLFRNVPGGFESLQNSNPYTWTVDEVMQHVTELPGCAKAAEILSENGVDGHALLAMSQDDLTNELNIRTGPAIKIESYITLLREEVNSRWFVQ